FNLVGTILFINAVRATIRHRRFGNTYFEFDTLPFSPGERVGGKIHLTLDARAEHGVNLRLSCVRKVVSGSGDSRSTNQIVLWQADQNVPAGAVGPGPLGRAIPVDFLIPTESSNTDCDNSNDQILWRLHAQADVPGVDYSDNFEIPVFRSAGSSATANDFGTRINVGADNFGFATPQPANADSGAVPQPAQAKVVVSMVPVASMQQGTSSGNQLHAIRMRLKDGGKFTLADEIDSRQEARWVVSQIETLAGLKLDTHVEVDLPLGVSAQPLRQTPGQVF